MSRGHSARSFAVVFVFLFLSLSRIVQGENNSTTTSNTNLPPALIELFTSEGCSSCPPADVLLKKLDAAQPIPGAQLIVLSEHVTYWDHDGWKDPNSSPVLTERQNSYESALGGNTVYTPQLIVDGSHEVRAADPKQIQDTLQKAAATPKVAVRIGDVSIDSGNPTQLRARIETEANFENHSADIYVAVALDHVESQ